MIPAEIYYKTYDQEHLAIIAIFKTWRYYLEGYKYEIFVLTDRNNLCWFINMKSFSSSQFCWTKELSQYYFQIDYYWEKANVTADILFFFSQRSQTKEKILWDKNTEIFHYLQTSQPH